MSQNQNIAPIGKGHGRAIGAEAYTQRTAKLDKEVSPIQNKGISPGEVRLGSAELEAEIAMLCRAQGFSDSMKYEMASFMRFQHAYRFKNKMAQWQQGTGEDLKTFPQPWLTDWEAQEQNEELPPEEKRVA